MEALIERGLNASGYFIRLAEHYDKENCLDSAYLGNWILLEYAPKTGTGDIIASVQAKNPSECL